MRNTLLVVIGAAVLLSVGTAAASPVVWTGPALDFAKAAGGDPTLAANQDRITDAVWLTRGALGGIYNAAPAPAGPAEAFFSPASPAGTAWAFSGLDSNPTGAAFGASHFNDLHFEEWASSLGGSGALQSNIVNRPGVLHLLSEDIYLDITFTAFGSGRTFPSTAGAFAYTRSTFAPSAVPVPPALALLGPALGVLGWRGFRRRGRSGPEAAIKGAT